MSFAHPWFLLLLLGLPLMAWLRGRRGQPPAFVYSSAQLVRGLVNITRYKAGGFLAVLRWLVLALFIVALAQPRLIKSQTTIKASGVDIVVALDMSGSMNSLDFKQDGKPFSRIEMAKDVLKKFVDKRPSDRIGLVVFAASAYIATPMTLDHDFLLTDIDRLQIGAIDPDSTAIGSGLSTAVNRLRDLKAKSKIVILMTDGENNSGKIAPLTAAEAAHALGVKVYTIGVGKQGTSPMPMGRDPFSGEIVYREEPVDIDEDTLTKIANMTGGKYYRADNAEKFHAIYDEIDKQEKTEAEIKKYAEYLELFPWFVAAGMTLLLTEVSLGQTVFRRLP